MSRSTSACKGECAEFWSVVPIRDRAAEPPTPAGIFWSFGLPYGALWMTPRWNRRTTGQSVPFAVLYCDEDLVCHPNRQYIDGALSGDEHIAAIKAAVFYTSQEESGLPLSREKGHRLVIEGNEGFSAKPIAFVGNDAISKIAACVEHQQTGLHSRSVHFYVGGGQ